MDRDTVLGSKSGLMELNMKESGDIIKLMGRENSFMLMETSTKVNGTMIRQTVTAFISMSMVLDMKVIGRMTCKVALE